MYGTRASTRKSINSNVTTTRPGPSASSPTTTSSNQYAQTRSRPAPTSVPVANKENNLKPQAQPQNVAGPSKGRGMMMKPQKPAPPTTAPAPRKQKPQQPPAPAHPAILISSSDDDSDLELANFLDEHSAFKVPAKPPKVPSGTGRSNHTPPPGPPTLREYYGSRGVRLSTVKKLTRQYIDEEGDPNQSEGPVGIWWNNFEPPEGYTAEDLYDDDGELSQATTPTPSPQSYNLRNVNTRRTPTVAPVPPPAPYSYAKASRSVERRILRPDEKRRNLMQNLQKILGKDLVPPVEPVPEEQEAEVQVEPEAEMDFPSDDEDVDEAIFVACTQQAEEEFFNNQPTSKKPKLDIGLTPKTDRGSGSGIRSSAETPKSGGGANRHIVAQKRVVPVPAPKQLTFNFTPTPPVVGGEGFESDQEDQDPDDLFLSQLPY